VLDILMLLLLSVLMVASLVYIAGLEEL